MLIGGVLVGSAAPGGAQEPVGYDCDSTKFRLLFWPEGHTAIPSVNFPEFLTPHLEVYLGAGKKYVDEDVVGYADPTGAQVSQEKCTQTTAPGQDVLPPAKLKTEKGTAKITCKLKESPVLATGTVPGSGSVLTLSIGNQRVAVVTMTDVGADIEAEVLYNGKLCKSAVPPK